MKRLALILALAAWPCVAAADITTGLIARYELDGNALDSSPYANHGTANATLVATTDRFGTPNGAYEFNGLDSYITVPNSASLASPSTDITMAAWILLYGNSKVGSDFSPILMKSASSENAFMYRMIAHPTYFGSCYNNWGLHQNTAAAIPSTEWHHVATTFNGTRHKFYFDGVQVSDQALALTITADTRPLWIGADTPGAFEVFWGKMDDVRIYARTLSAEDIAELYAFVPVGVGDAPLGTALAIRSAFPMPATGGMTIEYTLPTATNVDFSILDARGRQVHARAIRVQPAGPHSIVWSDRVAAGVYFVKLRTPQAQAVARVVRID